MVERARIALGDAFQMGKNAIAPFVPGILDGLGEAGFVIHFHAPGRCAGEHPKRCRAR